LIVLKSWVAMMSTEYAMLITSIIYIYALIGNQLASASEDHCHQSYL
jgi:hypothetical protein